MTYNCTKFEDNKCIIENQNFKVRWSFKLNYSKGSVEFRNTNVTCRSTILSIKCLINIIVSGEGSELKLSHSMLDGHFVIIEVDQGKLSIDEHSEITASGHSWYGKGTVKGFGGSYAGLGGNCDKNMLHIDHTYGSHDLEFQKDFINDKRHLNFIGSAGSEYFKATYGGGIIAIYAQKLYLAGVVSSNGFPRNDTIIGEYQTFGGSGGYIYLNLTGSGKDKLTLVNNGVTSIEVKGGHGNKGGYSGSGGRVVISGEDSVNQDFISARGGFIYNSDSDDLCQIGAAGTIYFNNTDTVVIKNHRYDLEGRSGFARMTPLSYSQLKDYVAKEVNATSFATITLKPSKNERVVYFRNLTLNENSTFVEPFLDQSFDTYAIYGNNIAIKKNSTLILGINSEKSLISLENSFELDEESRVRYDKQLTIYCKDDIIIYGELLMLQKYEMLAADTRLRVNLRSDSVLKIGDHVKMYCYTCVLIGEKGLEFKGEIINDRNTCYSDVDNQTDTTTTFH